MKNILFLILNNEILLLHDRLINDIKFYDEIIISEANSTFSGLNKPFFHEIHYEKFAKFGDKCKFIKINNLVKPNNSKIYIGSNGRLINENRWGVEHSMRNSGMRELSRISEQYSDNSILHVYDVDEILNFEYFMSNKLNDNEIFFQKMYEFRGSLETAFLSDQLIRGGFSIKLSTLKNYNLNFNNIRHIRKELNGDIIGWNVATNWSIKNIDGSDVYDKIYYEDLNLNEDNSYYGWHLTSLHGGNSSIINYKVENFSHNEYSSGININAPDLFEMIPQKKLSDLNIGLYDIPLNAPKFLLDATTYLDFYLPK